MTQSRFMDHGSHTDGRIVTISGHFYLYLAFCLLLSRFHIPPDQSQPREGTPPIYLVAVVGPKIRCRFPTAWLTTIPSQASKQVRAHNTHTRKHMHENSAQDPRAFCDTISRHALVLEE
jgi:hypothetical protein